MILKIWIEIVGCIMKVIHINMKDFFFNLGRSFVARQIWFGSIIFDPKDFGRPDPAPHAAVQVERILRRIVNSESGNSGAALTKVSAGTVKSGRPGFFAGNYWKKTCLSSISWKITFLWIILNQSQLLLTFRSEQDFVTMKIVVLVLIHADLHFGY